MDPKADDPELNKGIPISITEESICSSTRIHPLQILRNRMLVRSYISGRNVVITAGENSDDHLVFITGMEPKYGEYEGTELREAIGARVFDIVDILPELPPEKKQFMRTMFVNTKYLLNLENLLTQEQIFEVDVNDIRFILENISPEIKSIFLPLKIFIELIDFEKTEFLPSNIFEEHKRTLQVFFDSKRDVSKTACSDLLIGLKKIVN